MFIIQCDDNNNDFIQKDYTTVPAPFSIEGVTKSTTESGVIYYDIEEGSGDLSIQIRDDVTYYYSAWKRNIPTLENIIGSTYADGSIEPTSLVSIVSTQTIEDRFSIIPGSQIRVRSPYMAEGVIGMKVGGKRVLIFPPQLLENSGDTVRVDFELAEIAY